ncbi:2Fe-2S iron-sulfur cluster binding domain-containing protein [Xylophilus rhododendri]|uniref:2Fe-2S iron-sulfur cluster binding domain-containing protein n=1 Tax=Xylophilus rhododendri TaxID=2697032 RepID=A0A857J684_9BURK|nr:2Fe-2S iron-sulfur cluster-binding protein [Xylophilus rhododendri]QHI98599.1 2Fe-2S iron-sulfur cluster binding domain-containing protein [Xylophilus rhododendri]
MAYRVHLMEPAASFEVDEGETLLEGADRAGQHLPHDCRFGTCGTCRVRVASGSVGYQEFPPGISEEEAAAGFALACQAHALSDVTLLPERRLAPCSAPARHMATVSAVRALGDGVSHLTITLPEAAAADLVYRPGQYVNLFLEDGSPRSFSMASRPEGGQLDFHLRRIPEGRFTHHRVNALQAGDLLEIELPLGNFCHHPEDYRPLLLVATGTGLAPIKAILESLMDSEDGPPVALYWGVRTEADLYLHEEIQTWAERFDDFSYVPVLSRADEDWQGRRGHVQQAVAEDFPDLSEHAIYLCGSPAMIEEARRDFLALGASIDHLYADSFTFQAQAAETV